MFISSVKQAARWSSCFLAFTLGVAPAAQATDSGLWVAKRSITQKSRSLLSKPGFAFRSIFISPQYAQQAETPLPLSWWEQGSSSPVAIAIGVAEGTRQPDGSRTAAYYWHTDPGNAADNFGSFSFQHFAAREKAPVQQQDSTDDKRWVAARRALPELADRRQMKRLRRFHDQLLAQAQAHQLQLSPLELLNGLDLANQSELAALDRWGYIDRLAQAKQLYSDPDEQILQARTWSYWHPTLHQWDAPGLGNTQASITRDQRRRAEAVKQVLHQEEQRTALLDKLNPKQVQRQYNRAGAALADDWVLTAFAAQGVATVATEGAEASSVVGSGFAEQPLAIAPEQPLLELLRETQRQTLAPEQEADISLAEALAYDELEAERRAEAILAVETEVALVLETPLPESQATGSGAETLTALDPSWQSGLLMASLDERPEAAIAEREEANPLALNTAAGTAESSSLGSETTGSGASSSIGSNAAISNAAISNIATSNTATSNTATSNAVASGSLLESFAPEPPMSENPQSRTPAPTSPPPSLSSVPSPGESAASTTPASATESVKQPAIQPSSTSQIPLASSSSDGDRAQTSQTSPTPGQTAAAIPASIGVAVVAEKSSEALAQQVAHSLPEPAAPSLSEQAEALTQPATAASQQALEGLLRQHMATAEAKAQQLAQEAAARQAAAREAAQKTVPDNPVVPRAALHQRTLQLLEEHLFPRQSGPSSLDPGQGSPEQPEARSPQPISLNNSPNHNSPNHESVALQPEEQSPTGLEATAPTLLGSTMRVSPLDAQTIADHIIQFEGLSH